jgi:hypothetical protein
VEEDLFCVLSTITTDEPIVAQDDGSASTHRDLVVPEATQDDVVRSSSDLIVTTQSVKSRTNVVARSGAPVAQGYRPVVTQDDIRPTSGIDHV